MAHAAVKFVAITSIVHVLPALVLWGPAVHTSPPGEPIWTCILHRLQQIVACMFAAGSQGLQFQGVWPACVSSSQHVRSARWRQVACTEREFPLNELKVQPHRPMLESMAASLFCLILPGNSQSSQRITEAFLTGCIPVFLGPPWHTLPFAHEVRSAVACSHSNGGHRSADPAPCSAATLAPGPPAPTGDTVVLLNPCCVCKSSTLNLQSVLG